MATNSRVLHPQRLDAPPNLRRADWRFLLPASSDEPLQHLVILGGPPSLNQRIRETGIARQVSDRLPVQRCVDALALLHGSHVRLPDAAASLVPGGLLYYEVERRSARSSLASPARVCRAMRRIGFVPTGVYAIAPGFDDCKRYIPLDVAGAFNWYMSTLFAAAAPAQHLVKTAARAVTGFNGRRFARFTPSFAVTAKLGACDCTAPAILSHPAVLHQSSGALLYPFLLTSGADDGSRVVMMPFTEESSGPVMVLKVARSPDFNVNTVCEQQTLEQLRSRLDGSMRRTVPEPLGTFRLGDLVVGMESPAAGSSMLVSGWQWRRPLREKVEDLRLASGWLSAFHRQLRANDHRIDVRDRIGSAITKYVDAFGETPTESRLFARAEMHAESLTDITLPAVWQHNDFGPWNVYRSNRDVTVIDWEFRGELEQDRLGLPLCDLIYFVTYWSFVVNRLHDEEGERRIFAQLFLSRESREDTVIAARRAIAEYLDALAIDRRVYPLLLTYTWIERATDRHERQRVLGSTALSARTNNRFISYLDVLARGVEILFADEGAPDERL